MQHTPRLADRLALITGATRGIGRAVALAYAREGAHLILVGRTAGALEEVDDEVREFGRPATLLTLNLNDHDRIDALGDGCATLTPRVAAAMRQLDSGQVLAVLSDDPAAAEGIAAWSRLTGHAVVAAAPEGAGTRFYLRHKEKP